jgi:hypothetical protein
LLAPGRAAAEKVLAKVNDWEVYSDGRVGGFLSWTHGDGGPQPIQVPNPGGGFVTVSQPGLDGSFRSVTDLSNLDPNNPAATGTIDMWRVRSGYLSNIFGFGLRGPVTESTKVSVYLQLWMFIENDGRQKNQLTVPDARQGYVKLEGPWGSLAVGRMRGLFARGETDIDTLYAHRWGLGFPGAIDNHGPTQGQIGFGILGSGFSSGVVYGTPVLGHLLQLDIGAFDPVQIQGQGAWQRTKYPRLEAELTMQTTWGDGWGKLVLFGNGVHQKVYRDPCSPTTDPDTMDIIPCDTTVVGASYGGRLELGPVHIGVAGHYGQGLGLNYALDVSDAAQDKEGNLRTTTGFYGQTQVVLGKFDVFAGAGLVQVQLTDYDRKHRDPFAGDSTMLIFPTNVLKRRIGINAGIVYNVTPNLHVDLDFFRAQADWYPVHNEDVGAPYFAPKQVVFVSNAGMTVNW